MASDETTDDKAVGVLSPAMVDWDARHVREVALDQAVGLHKTYVNSMGGDIDGERIVKTAQSFEAFLKGNESENSKDA